MWCCALAVPRAVASSAISTKSSDNSCHSPYSFLCRAAALSKLSFALAHSLCALYACDRRNHSVATLCVVCAGKHHIRMSTEAVAEGRGRGQRACITGRCVRRTALCRCRAQRSAPPPLSGADSAHCTSHPIHSALERVRRSLHHLNTKTSKSQHKKSIRIHHTADTTSHHSTTQHNTYRWH